MTTGLNAHETRGWRGVALIAFAAAGLCGCTTASLEDAAPMTATVEATLPEQTSAIPTPTPSGASPAALPDTGVAAAGESVDGTAAEAPRSARTTDQYPNLNIVPTAAAPQLTAADRRAKLAELAAAQKQAERAASGKPISNDAKLKKLAKTHAQNALKEIEGQ